MKKIVIRKGQEPVVELNIMEDSDLDFTIVDYTKKEDRYKEACIILDKIKDVLEDGGGVQLDKFEE
mgnify:CR=1 FL=1